MAESHTHDDHAPIEDIDRAPTKYEILEQTIRELLIEKKVLTADAIRGQMEDMESRSPEKGAEVVVRAWTDPQFKALLLRNGTAAVETMGVDRHGFCTRQAECRAACGGSSCTAYKR